MFAKESDTHVKLDSSFWDDVDKVTPKENDSLVAPFSEAKIKSALFSYYPEGAPGPDGLPFLFYQKLWEVIKDDLVALFEDFHKGELDLYIGLILL